MVRILDAKGAKVVVAAAQGPFNRAVAHLKDGYLRHPLPPATVPGGQTVPVGMNECRGMRGIFDAGQHGQDGAPVSVRGDGCPVNNGLRRYICAGGLDNRGLPDVLPDCPDGELVAVSPAGFVPAPLDAGFFQLEEIGEVRLDQQCDLTCGWLQGVVAHGDLILDACPHFPQPFHDQGTVGVAVGAGNPSDKQCPVRLLRLCR
jgi:hypothetical protein